MPCSLSISLGKRIEPRHSFTYFFTTVIKVSPATPWNLQRLPMPNKKEEEVISDVLLVSFEEVVLLYHSSKCIREVLVLMDVCNCGKCKASKGQAYYEYI